MKRRDLLRWSASAGATAGLGAAGCGAVGDGFRAAVPSLAELASLDMDGFLGRLDRATELIRTTTTLSSILPDGAERRAAADPRFTKADDLIRTSMAAMTLFGSFTDLPEAGRLHPGMQERLWRAMPDLEQTVLGWQSTLDALTPTERADIARELRKDPAKGHRVIDALDAEAARVGVSDARRAHLEQTADHVLFRLRQSTPGFFQEMGSKIEKARAADGALDAWRRQMMAQLGQGAFWQVLDRQNAITGQWQQLLGKDAYGPAQIAAAQQTGSGAASSADVPPGSPPPPATVWVPPPGSVAPAPGAPPPGTVLAARPSDEPRSERNGVWTLRASGIAWGFAALEGLVGLLMLVNASGGGGLAITGAISLTTAAGHALGALIAVIVGAIQYGSDSR